MIHAYKCPMWSHGTHRGDSPIPVTLWSAYQVWWSCTFSFTKAPHCLKLQIQASNAIGRWAGSLLNCHRIDSWTETTDLCLTNCNTQNAFRSGVDIVAVLRHRPREKRGMGLRTSRKLEHLLFHSMWKTYFCMRFQSRDGRLKPLQSFWYTLCVYSLPYLEWY